MPDWRQLVRARLGPLGLSREREREIVEELADHLEDRYAWLVEQGMPPEKAGPMAVEEVTNWRGLGCEIRSAEEEEMNARTKSFWLPGMGSLFVSSVLLMVISRIGPRPLAVSISSQTPPLVFYVPWLVLLPLCGALGAYWSRQAGGRPSARMMAAVFPVLTLVALLVLIGMPVALAVDRVPLAIFASAFAYAFLGWVIIPGAALFLGALPFLRNSAHKTA